MKVNKRKRQVLPLGRNSTRHQDRLGTKWLESSFAEVDLVVLIDTKLSWFNPRQQLSTTQPLTPPPSQWDGEEDWKKK